MTQLTNTDFEPKSYPIIVTTVQLAERLNVDVKTIARWRDKGMLPFLKICGAYRYDLYKVIESLEHPKTL